MGFEHARRFRDATRERLHEFAWTLSSGGTRLLEFGSYAAFDTSKTKHAIAIADDPPHSRKCSSSWWPGSFRISHPTAGELATSPTKRRGYGLLSV